MKIKELESKPNWIATFKRTRRNVKEKYDCLMKSFNGSYYWHTPDYEGMFMWVTTRSFDAKTTIELLKNKDLELVKGELILELQIHKT